MAANGGSLPFRVTGTSRIRQWVYGLVNIKITESYALKRQTLCYMNYISIFKNGEKDLLQLNTKKTNSPIKNRQEIRADCFHQRRSMGAREHQGASRLGSQETRFTPLWPRVAQREKAEAAACWRGHMGRPHHPWDLWVSRSRLCRGTDPTQGCLGNLRRTVPWEGAGGVSPVHKVPKEKTNL